MPTLSTRMAYIRRMLNRLDGQSQKLQELVSLHEFTPEQAELALRQIGASREKLLSELRDLETPQGDTDKLKQ